MITTITFLFTFMFGYLAGFWTLVVLLNKENNHGEG